MLNLLSGGASTQSAGTLPLIMTMSDTIGIRSHFGISRRKQIGIRVRCGVLLKTVAK